MKGNTNDFLPLYCVISFISLLPANSSEYDSLLFFNPNFDHCKQRDLVFTALNVSHLNRVIVAAINSVIFSLKNKLFEMKIRNKTFPF